jgi:hypothetical protein
MGYGMKEESKGRNQIQQGDNNLKKKVSIVYHNLG